MQRIIFEMKEPPKECEVAHRAWEWWTTATEEEKDCKRRQIDEKNEELIEVERKRILTPKTWKKSLWPAGREIRFCFRDWDYTLQTDHETAKAVACQAKALSDKIIAGSTDNAAFIGGTGCGKTSLAIAILTACRKQSMPCMVLSTAELVSSLDSSYGYDDARRQIAKVEQAAVDCSVLLLDDLGVEGGPQIKPVRRDMAQLMYRISNARLDKATLVTTNNTPAELGRMYDERIVSRLIPKSKGQIVDMRGLDDVRGR